MKKILPLTIATLVLLSGCVVVMPAAQRAAATDGSLTPEQSIQLAAKAAPEGVRGTFAMLVQATGTQNNRVFLNSELDYRDQRNLTISLTDRAARQLAKKLGADPLVALKGREIMVNSSAVRTKIFFVVDGRMTDKYYYQTHVNIADSDQITIQ